MTNLTQDQRNALYDYDRALVEEIKGFGSNSPTQKRIEMTRKECYDRCLKLGVANLERVDQA